MTFLIENGDFRGFLIATLFLGGGASWLMGRAIAATWRPIWHVVPYALVLGAAARFIHYALFGHTLLSLQYYIGAAALCLIAALLGFRVRRVRQMLRQYGFLYRFAPPLSWRRTPPQGEVTNSG